MLTAAKEASPVSIGNDVRYTSLFLFSCLSSCAAKRKNPAIQAPHLWLKRPHVQKPLLGDFRDELYHIKKEFDEDREDLENGVAGIQAYYSGRRFYDPEIGVWFSADPVEQDWNVYSYCGNNPIMYVDPYGLSWKGFWRGFGIAMADMATGGLISGSAQQIIARKDR